MRIEADGKAPADGELWIVEHGPQGSDELNVPAAGANQGWPVITYGRNYEIGTKIGDGTERADVAAPLRQWIPSIAPSGMAFLTSERYPGWKGNLFVGALRCSHLVRLKLDGRKVVNEEQLLTERSTRIRDVCQGPDGWPTCSPTAPTSRGLAVGEVKARVTTQQAMGYQRGGGPGDHAAPT